MNDASAPVDDPASSTSPTPRWIPAMLAASVIVFYWDILTFRGVLFHFDLIGLNAPIRSWFFHTVSGGHLPLWCPDVCGGFPLFAEGQLGPLYLFNYLLFPFLPVEIGLNLTVVAHGALAVAGAYLYLKRTHRPIAAAIGAICFGYSAYLVFHVVHLMLFQSACLLPWLYLLADHYLAERRWSGALGAGFVLGLMLYTGQQQGPLLAALGFGLYLAVLAIDAAMGGRARDAGRILAGGVVIALTAAGMATVLVVGVRELLEYSVRSESLDAATLYTQSLVPRLWPRLATFALHGRWMDDTWLLPDYTEKEIAVYLGLAAWIFAPMALAGRTSARTRAHLAVAAFGLLFVLGAAGPFEGVVEHIPFLNRMRIPTRFTQNLAFSFSFLVAAGVDRLIDTPRDVRRRLLTAGGIGVGVWIALVIVGARGTYAFASDTATGVTEQILDAVRSQLTAVLAMQFALMAVLAVLAVLAMRAGNDKRRQALLALIFVVVFVDLHLAGRGENPVIGRAAYGPFATVDKIREMNGPFRLYSYVGHEPYGHGGWARGLDPYLYGVEGLPQSTPLLFGLNTASCGSSLEPARHARVREALNLTWLRRMSVKFALAIEEELSLPLIMNTGRVRLHEVPQPMPLVHAASNVVPVGDEEQAYQMSAQAQVDLGTTAYVENYDGPAIHSEGARPFVQAISEAPDEREYQVASRQPIFLVMHENYFPGWRATVDDVPVTTYRANYLHWGVPIPAGEHRVVLEYAPSGFGWAMVVSLLFAFSAPMFAVVLWRKENRTSDGVTPLVAEGPNRPLTVAVAALFVVLLIVGAVRHPDLW
ncbi:YfhO family protein [bacterium]|nr:YfhO family protein [bacterium]